MKKKTIIEIDYNELEQLVYDKLGFKQYDFVCAQECGNDSSHSFVVDGKISKWDKENLDKWAEGKDMAYGNQTVLNALCAKGFIEAGEYIVSVYW